MKTRGFTIYEHDVGHDYVIKLNADNEYYDRFKGSDIENSCIPMKTDENGFMIPDYIPDKAVQHKMVMLGDSTIECTFVEPCNRISYVCAKELSQITGVGVACYNGGVSGADTLSLIKVLVNKVFPMRPNSVFLCNVERELIFLLSPKSDLMWGANNNKPRVVYLNEFNQMNIIQRMYYILKIMTPLSIKRKLARKLSKQEADILCTTTRNKLAHKEILDYFRKGIITFCTVCKLRDIDVVLATQANQYMGCQRIEDLYNKYTIKETNISYEKYCALYSQCNDIIRDIANEMALPLVDLEKEVGNNNEFLYDAIHYSNMGATHIGRFIARQLNELKMIKRLEP